MPTFEAADVTALLAIVGDLFDVFLDNIVLMLSLFVGIAAIYFLKGKIMGFIRSAMKAIR